MFVLLFEAASLSAQVSQPEYAARRAALAATMKDGVLLALGAPEPAQDYLSFFQSPDFYYLTGFREPDAALVMVKRGDAVTSTMFVEPRLASREVWSGARLGADGVTRRTGMPARNSDQLAGVLDSLAGAGLPLFVVGGPSAGNGGSESRVIQSLKTKHPSLQVTSASHVVGRARGKKSPAELALIRKAVDITAVAQREAMRLIEPGMNEFEVQALIEYTFRRNGADRPSFATIVGSGPNSTTLHYNADDRFMEAGEVVVMDIGASYAGYAADVTRTVPVSGTFTPSQRAIYQLVRDAQAAAERQATLGASAAIMEDSARTTLALGLAKLGLIESPEAVYDGDPQRCPEPGCPQWQLYYMHGVGHGIGLEVHDPEQYYFQPNQIAPGSAFTIEPGLYVRANLFETLRDTPRNRAMIEKLRPALERYRNIGVRIEDDYIATDRGVEWISRAPREIGEIEAIRKEPFAGPVARNPELVKGYRQSREMLPR